MGAVEWRRVLLEMCRQSAEYVYKTTRLLIHPEHAYEPESVNRLSECKPRLCVFRRTPLGMNGVLNN